MSRSYTNSEGMIVEVTKDHLDTAIEIKLELQNHSPSRRCNWDAHKRMMEQEGYHDSDNNESYRCLVKAYQKEVGKLTPLHSYADMVATSKLESIRMAVGEMYYAKRENQEVLKELNKLKRGLSTTALAVEELRNVYIDDIDFTVPHYVYSPVLPTSKHKAIVVITDWHIGMVVEDCLGNNYNFEIATKRVAKLKQEVLDYCKLFNITELYVLCLGDMIEHLYMRDNQSQDAEFSMSMQIAKAQKLILDFIVSLSEYVNVTYSGIAGNHDRLNGNKSANFDGDNAMVIINEGIKDMLGLIKSDRIRMIENNIYDDSIKLELNGKKFKFTHGDNDWGNKKHLLKAHISMDEEFYDVWVHGHLHNWYVQEEDHGRMIIGVGCLQGRNNYSKKLACATNAGQGIIIVREDGSIMPQRIDLQII